MNCYLWEWIRMITLFRQCTIDDLDILPSFSRQRYFETFADMNTPDNMTAYLDEAFALEKIRAEQSDANAAFYFLYWDGKLAGYLKLNEASAQTDLHDEQSLEIERIYVSKEFQGEGLGRYLMDQAISIAIQRKKKFGERAERQLGAHPNAASGADCHRQTASGVGQADPSRL